MLVYNNNVQKPDNNNLKWLSYYDILLKKYCPILYYNSRKEKEIYKASQEASSVLIYFGGSHFLISAGHVFNELNPKYFGLFIDNEFYPFDGFLKSVDFSLSKLHNALDISIFRLSDRYVNDIKSNYFFLDYNNLDFNHILNNNIHYVFGYPYKLTKEDKDKKKFKINPLEILVKQSDKSIYSSLDYDIKYNFIFDFDRFNCFEINSSKPFVSKEIDSMSGCGIWYDSKYSEKYDGKPNIKLISILTDHINDKYIISTRINYVIALLRDNFFK